MTNIHYKLNYQNQDTKNLNTIVVM